MQVKIEGEPVKHCTPPLFNNSVLNREYDGITVYTAPSVCSLDYPTLTVVHGDLHTPSCTGQEIDNEHGLWTAVVGETAKYEIVARDAFGNIRYTKSDSKRAILFKVPISNTFSFSLFFAPSSRA